MKEIGGYFEVEFPENEGGGIHTDALWLNSGRNCFAYILEARGYTHVHLPYYICDVVTEQLKSRGISFSFYTINENLEPETLPDFKENEAFVYVNYFGIKSAYVHVLALTGLNLIVDNSQALFDMPVRGADTFYSLRKFVGVTDGGFLFYYGKAGKTVDYSVTYPSAEYLYTRRNFGANAGYAAFRANEAVFDGLPVGKMSKASAAFVKSYDFNRNRVSRERNYLYLHGRLAHLNQLKVAAIPGVGGPLCYPFLCGNVNLKKVLLEQKIYVATYWPNLDLEPDSYESYLVSNLLPLPVDQRYGTDDMGRMTDVIVSNLK